jgi:integrase
VRNTLDLDNIIAADLDNSKQAEVYVKQFIDELKARGVSEYYIKSCFVAIRHFYDMNDCILNWRRLARFVIPATISAISEEASDEQRSLRRDRTYTRDDILRMLEAGATNLRTRAIILLLASSGIRIGAAHILRLRHLKKESEGLYQITVYPGSREEYLTFCTPEAASAIDSYLDLRTRAGEVLSPDSPLFRTDFDASDHVQARHNVKRLKGPQSLTSSMRRILQQQTNISPHVTLLEGQKSGSVVKEIKMFHGFRKFTNTMMIQSDMKVAAKEMLLGHSIGLDDRYYRPTPQQLLDEYLKAVDLLTIKEENRLKITVKELTAKTKTNEYLIKDKLEEKDKQIETLMKKQKEMEKKFQLIFAKIDGTKLG